MEQIYKALGWQGGTIHQIIDEINRLKNIEACYKREHGFRIMWAEYDDSDTIGDYCFDSNEEAVNYAESCRFEYNNYIMNESGDEILHPEFRFYDPKSKETYWSYRVLPF